MAELFSSCHTGRNLLLDGLRGASEIFILVSTNLYFVSCGYNSSDKQQISAGFGAPSRSIMSADHV